MRMLKKALIAYVNSMKAVWSAIAHPLSIVSKRKGTLKGYRIYGNSVQEGEPTPENPIEVQSVGELTTKNLLYSYRSVSKYGNTITMDGSEMLLEGKCIETTSNSGLSYSSAESILLEAGKTYTFSYHYICGECINAPNNFYVGLRKTDNSWFISLVGINQNNYKITKKITFTVEEDTLVSFGYVGRGEFNELRTGIQLKEGNGSDYEPYHKYKVPVTVRGKNLFDKSKAIKGSYIDDANGEFVVNENYYASDYIEVTPSTVYYFTKQSSANWGAWYDENKTFISGILGYTSKRAPSNARYCRISVHPSYLDRMQIEAGSETSYEPYIEPQIHNIYLNEPLRKIGDYADCVDFDKGVVKRNVKAITKFGSNDFKQYSDAVVNNNPLSPLGIGTIVDKNTVMCSYDSKAEISNTQGTKIAFNLTDNGIDYTSETAMEEWTQLYDSWIESGKFFLQYALAEPIEEPIELPKLPQFKGTTIYEVQADITPSGMEVQYYE